MSLSDRLTVEITCAEAVNQFLVEQKIAHRTRRTLEYYSYNLQKFLDMPDLPKILRDTGKPQVLQYLNEKIDKPWVADARYRALRSFYNWAVEQRYCLENPVERTKRPDLPRPEIHTLSPQDFKQLLALCPRDTFLGRRNRALLLMFYDTGLRLDEMTKLTIPNIDIDAGILRIIFGAKGDKERRVRIGDTTRLELWNYLKMHGGRYEDLWLSVERKPITQAAIVLVFRGMKKKTGIDVHAHLFRHTFAITFLRNSGGDLATLQYLLGNEKIATTMLYLKSLKAEDAIKAHIKFSPVDRLI